jgi:hypothetical protein
VHTRPNIAFIVDYVSCFMESPTTEHLNTVKHVLCYVVGTIDFSCLYQHGGKESWSFGYNNTDMGSDVDTRKSTTGVVFYLGSSHVT